ncbi:D-glycero-beta-D-manno-heptose 1-phosphate adenylyltransferase [Flavobacteriales bacterium]|nr:D-glycero-beta-D-manno-heptose 1-phosphate adenylyltransferase [Flavobacteriales bacterium]
MTVLQQVNDKIVTLNNAKQITDRWSNERICFTNGCFDLLHLGHIDYLSKAADLADKLIIGVNTDQSVSKLKGSHRPIKDEVSRATILASLSFVDLVILFDEETPLNLIETIQPDILVKGADYTIDNVVGAKETIQRGGKVELISFLDGYSTSSLELKIRNH